MRRMVFAVALLASAAVACGDDGGGADDAHSAACDALVAVDQAFVVNEDYEGAVTALADFVAGAPDDLAREVEPIVEPLRKAVAKGDLEAFETEEVAEAEAAFDEYAVENCGETVVEIEAVNYGFAGVPSEIASGRVVFNVSRSQAQTGEFHEALLLRKNDDVREPAYDAMAQGIEGPLSVETLFAAFENFTFRGAGLVEPDGSDSQDAFVVDLEPGEYILVCMLPVDSEELIEPYFEGEEVDAERHFDHGMFFEFTVT